MQQITCNLIVAPLCQISCLVVPHLYTYHKSRFHAQAYPLNQVN